MSEPADAATTAESAQEADVKFRAEHLARDMRSLGTRLVRIADQLDRNPMNTLLNSLGEIQAEGSIIDAGCGGHVAAKNALDLMRRLA